MPAAWRCYRRLVDRPSPEQIAIFRAMTPAERDIRSMLDVSGAEIDRALLDEWVARLGVAAEWALVSAV